MQVVSKKRTNIQCHLHVKWINEIPTKKNIKKKETNKKKKKEKQKQ